MNIKIKNLTKKYISKTETVIALNDISLELPSVGFVCICGSNGSGKSTFLNCISLMDENYEGEVLIDNKSIKDLSEKEKDSYRENVFGYVFQKNNLIGGISAKQNIELAKNLYKDCKFLEIVDEELPMKRKPKELSGGQQQKVAIYRALSQNKPIIICDEPTASLDYTNTKKLIKHLKEISKDRLVICVTHDREIVEENADRIIEFEYGKIKEDTIINETDEVVNVAFENKKANIFNLIKMGLLNFKKPFIPLCFSLILMFFFVVNMVLISYLCFDAKSALANNLDENKVYSISKTVKTEYIDGDEVTKVLGLTDEFIKDCQAYLDDGSFHYSIPNIYDGILFVKNSGIPLGECSIGDKSLKQWFDKDRLIAPFDIKITYGRTYVLKATSVFKGEGIKCDYENHKYKSNDELKIECGMWKNSKYDSDGINRYFDYPITYYPASAYNKNVSPDEQITLTGNEAIVSNYIGQYVDSSDYIEYFLNQDDFTNKDIFYPYVNMNEIYDSGIKFIGSVDKLDFISDVRFVIISDEKYEEIDNQLNYFGGISTFGKENMAELASIIIDHDYDIKISEYEDYTMQEIIDRNNDIKASTNKVLILISAITLCSILLLFIMVSVVSKNEFVSIGIFRCMGLSKIRSIISSCVFVLILILLSSILAVGFGYIICDYFNRTLNYDLAMANIDIFSVNSLVISFVLIMIVVLMIIGLLSVYLKNRNKNIREYFI